MNKRFTSNNGVFYTDNETGWEFQCYGEVVDLMNKLDAENKALHDRNRRLRNRNQRLHQDWDKLYQHLLDMGLMTDEEILKVIDYD